MLMKIILKTGSWCNMALIVYKFHTDSGSLTPIAAMSDSGVVRSNNAQLKKDMEGMEEAQVIDRFDNGITMTVEEENDGVAKKIWNRWGRNNDNE